MRFLMGVFGLLPSALARGWHLQHALGQCIDKGKRGIGNAHKSREMCPFKCTRARYSFDLYPCLALRARPGHESPSAFCLHTRGGSRGGVGGGVGVEGVATPCFIGQGRQDSLASQTLPAREGLACETAPRSGPLALTCKSRCHPR